MAWARGGPQLPSNSPAWLHAPSLFLPLPLREVSLLLLCSSLCLRGSSWMLPGALVPPSAWEAFPGCYRRFCGLLAHLSRCYWTGSCRGTDVANFLVVYSERPLVEVRGCAPPLLVLTSARIDCALTSALTVGVPRPTTSFTGADSLSTACRLLVAASYADCLSTA